MICEEAKTRLQEGFTWWKAHLEGHQCLPCSIVAAALKLNNWATGMLSSLGLRL